MRLYHTLLEGYMPGGGLYDGSLKLIFDIATEILVDRFGSGEQYSVLLPGQRRSYHSRFFLLNYGDVLPESLVG